MFEIVSTSWLPKDLIKSIWIKAPLIARNAKHGQFVVIRIDERGERIPLTICKYNVESGLINLIFKKVGVTTSRLISLNKGDFIKDVLGPLGNPNEAIRAKDVFFVAGGIGISQILAQIEVLNDCCENNIFCFYGGSTKTHLVLTPIFTGSLIIT